GLVGKVHGHHGTVFDTGGGVTDDVVDPVPQFLQNPLHAVDRQRFFVTGLGGWKDEEVIYILVLDKRLVQGCFLVDHVDEVIDHASFAIHDQVQVTQTDIEVDHGGFVAAQCDAARNGRAGCGFPDPTFTRGHRNNSGQ